MIVHLTEKSSETTRFSYRMGTGDMVFCFFSSVSYNLEGAGKWGCRFPRLLLDLCDYGIVENQHLDELRNEVLTVYRELQQVPITSAVYDISDPTIPIPWEIIPGEETNNLAQPWVTPRGGMSYLAVFLDQIDRAKRDGSPLAMIFPFESANLDALWKRKEKGRDHWLRYKNC